MHLDLVDLRLFVAVVNEGGLAAAARKANLSVSAVSERIKSLEMETGAILLTRTARGSAPTAMGVEFAAHAKTVLLQVERLDGTVASWRGRQGQGGRVAMLANSNAITCFLPDLLATFLARNAEVVIDLREALSDEIASAMRSGEADLGIAAETADLSGLEIRPFRRDELVLLVPAGHRFATRRQVDFSATLAEPFVGLDDTAAIQAYVAAQAMRLGRNLNLRIRLRSFDGVARMVAAGVGIAIAPASTYALFAHEPGIRSVRLTDQWATRNLVICLPMGQPPSGTLSRLLELLAN